MIDVKVSMTQKFLIVLSESPLKIGKIDVYLFLIPFLVPELLRFKDLKKDYKMVQVTARSTNQH